MQQTVDEGIRDRRQLLNEMARVKKKTKKQKKHEQQRH